MWIVNFQMFKLVLEKAEEPEIKLPIWLDHQKSKRIPEKQLLCFIDYAKAFDCVDHSKLSKIQTHKLLLENSSNIIDTSLNLSFLLLENWRWLPDCSASLMGYQ